MSTEIKRTTRGRDRWITIATDWAGYRAMLAIRGERGTPRIYYLDGRMTLVSPGYSHEAIHWRMGTLAQEVAAGFGLRGMVAGSTTFWLERRRVGVEGDNSFYFANADKVLGKKDIDLLVDPPPDLIIEAVVSHPVKDALEIYRRLRVPEVWVSNGRVVHIFVRGEDGRYASSSVSKALPMLTAEMILRWLQHAPDSDDISWMLDVRRWVAEELVPRYREGRP